MAYRLIGFLKVVIQFTIMDYIDGKKGIEEEIDLRTFAGRRRYKELFGHCPRIDGMDGMYSEPRTGYKNKDSGDSSLSDIAYVFKICNERTRRLVAGFLAKSRCGMGIKEAAELTRLDMKTIRKGIDEIEARTEIPKSRIRVSGGGRPSKIESDPDYNQEIETISTDEIAGDPMNGRTWIRNSLRKLKDRLSIKGIKASPSTIRKTFKEKGITLKKNKKYENLLNHPDREPQFQYLMKLKADKLKQGIPTISIDTKKKELIGNFKNDGKIWRKDPYKVLDHDFPSSAKGKLVPFGIYDLYGNSGYVYCGTSSETSKFVVDSLCDWWENVGQQKYPDQHELMIFCDAGGANGYRRKGWKWELNKMADRFNLRVTVCHYPTGASKYNPIEHKLFSFISINWAGEPLISYEKALGFINSTQTKSGLQVKGFLVEKYYKTGIKISDEQMKTLNITCAKVCPNWNYTISPRDSET